MKTLLFFLFSCFAFGQLEMVHDPFVIVKSDTLITQDFGVQDSLQLFLSVNDTCDADVYIEYSQTGIHWKRSAKLLDIDTDVAIDTALFYSSLAIPTPISKMRYFIIFAGSGNSTDGVGKLMAYIKRY